MSAGGGIRNRAVALGKGTARAWMPPVLADRLRRTRRTRTPPMWVAVPDGWRSARDYGGWDVESVAQTQVEKWPAYLHAIEGTQPLAVSHVSTRIDEHRTDGGELPGYTYAEHNAAVTFGYVLARAARGLDRMSILDWGGGLGHHAPLARALLPDVEIEYHCHDLPLVCREGTRLQPDVVFHDDAASALSRTYDLVLASNSLQYFEDWRAVLGQLRGATTTFLFLTRVPVVWSVPSYVVAQRPARFGYDTEYISWTFNQRDLLAGAADADLTLLREFLISERQPVPEVPEPWENRGFLFAARDG